MSLYAAAQALGTRQPSGAAISTATVTADALSFTGVTDDVPMAAYSAGRWVMVRKSVAATVRTWRQKVYDRRVALGTTLPGYTE